ncbi:MAG TPA: hypothetical protein VNZ55_01285 [Thermomicrobiales bacterium]|nr:hypothetical protein [Thermomicrobiales bacterium]
MTDQPELTDTTAGIQHFTWHPVYKGHDVEKVRHELIDEIGRDQRAYALALDAAEKDEHGALQTIMTLDARWSDFDLGWTEADPAALAKRVLAVESERERRHEMIPVSDLRASLNRMDAPASDQFADSDEVASGLHIPRWAYIAITVLVVLGLIALLIRIV